MSLNRKHRKHDYHECYLSVLSVLIILRRSDIPVLLTDFEREKSSKINNQLYASVYLQHECANIFEKRGKNR